MEIVLEPLQPDDAIEMFDGLADPVGYQFIPERPPDTVEVLRARYRRQAVGHSEDGSETWLNWIVRLRESGSAVGYTQATIKGGSAMVAYHIFPSYWHRGLGTAAVRSTLDRIFAMPVVTEVRALVDSRNFRSSSLLRKLGFGLERMVVDADHFKGSLSDEFEFAMPRTQWLQQSSRRHRAGGQTP